MGYTTTFEGRYNFNKKITKELANFINGLCSTRRMKRDVSIIKEVFPDWAVNCFNGDLGINGEFFVGSKENYGQVHDDSILDYNNPPATQPSLWLQWVVKPDDKKDIDENEFNAHIEWDGGEKFYEYDNWLEYLCDKILTPSGYFINGITLAVGEESEDASWIVVENNRVFVFSAMLEDAVDRLYEKFADNEDIFNILNEIKKSPADIISEYWDWWDEEE